MKFMIISGDKPETVMSIAKSISKTIPPLLSDVNQYK
jgi:magnesium-transporting ATPase (P-type)